MSRRAPDVADRRSGERSGGRRASDPLPLPITPESLDRLIDALEHFAGAMPPGRALFTAIYDAGAGASDLIIRDQDGDTRLILGLENAQHHRLEVLLAWVRGELDHRDAGLVAEMARLSGDTDPPARPEAGPSAPGEIAPPAEAAEADVADAPAASGPRASTGVDHQAILDQSPFPVLVVDRGQSIAFASRAVVTRLGMRDPGQLVGMSLASVVHPADQSELAALAGEGADAELVATVRLLRWDGLYAHAEISAQPMSDGQTLLVLTPVESGTPGTERSSAGAGSERWQMRTNTEVSTLQR